MGRNCQICLRDDIAAINARLVSGATERTVAAEFTLKKSTVHLHRSRCVAPAVQRAAEARQIKMGTAILDQLDFLAQKAGDVIARAEKKRRDTLLLTAIRECVNVLKLRADLSGVKREAAPRISYSVTFVGGKPVAQEEKILALPQTEDEDAIEAAVEQ